jgi:hypothetical protein
MPNLRFMMKFADGRLAWSERHWYYNGPPSVGPPPVSTTPNLAVATARAYTLLAARIAILPASTDCIGAVLSFDDTARDGTLVQPAGYPKFPGTPGPALDPELSVMCRGYSDPGLGFTYQSNFYVSPTFQGAVNDQTYDPSLNPLWDTALKAYLTALTTPATAPGWGWKAVAKLAAVGLVSIVPPLVLNVVGGQPQIVMTLSGALANVLTGDVVKITGARQGKGASPRINGRWIVIDNTAGILTLTRKYFPPYTTLASMNYVGGGLIVPEFHIIVPYTAPSINRLVKRDRGGTLGLSRGRARSHSSNV